MAPWLTSCCVLSSHRLFLSLTVLFRFALASPSSFLSRIRISPLPMLGEGLCDEFITFRVMNLFGEELVGDAILVFLDDVGEELFGLGETVVRCFRALDVGRLRLWLLLDWGGLMATKVGEIFLLAHSDYMLFHLRNFKHPFNPLATLPFLSFSVKPSSLLIFIVFMRISWLWIKMMCKIIMPLIFCWPCSSICDHLVACKHRAHLSHQGQSYHRFGTLVSQFLSYLAPPCPSPCLSCWPKRVTREQCHCDGAVRLNYWGLNSYHRGQLAVFGDLPSRKGTRNQAPLWLPRRSCYF